MKQLVFSYHLADRPKNVLVYRVAAQYGPNGPPLPGVLRNVKHSSQWFQCMISDEKVKILVGYWIFICNILCKVSDSVTMNSALLQIVIVNYLLVSFPSPSGLLTTLWTFCFEKNETKTINHVDACSVREILPIIRGQPWSTNYDAVCVDQWGSSPVIIAFYQN